MCPAPPPARDMCSLTTTSLRPPPRASERHEAREVAASEGPQLAFHSPKSRKLISKAMVPLSSLMEQVTLSEGSPLRAPLSVRGARARLLQLDLPCTGFVDK